jgi:hypothetical protein
VGGMMWLAILQTVFLAMLVPVYWREYGPQNFLWMSDIALIVSTVALSTRSSVLCSMEAVAVLVFEIVWCIDILFMLMIGERFAVLSNYMFQREIPLWIRLLSLFHLWIPWLLLWMVWQLGYDRRALVLQINVWVVVIVVCYFVSTPEENINFVHGLGSLKKRLSPAGYMAALLVGVPVVIYLPTHLFLSWWAGR